MMDTDALFYDYQPTSNNMLREVLVGLSKMQKTLPPKFLYDQKGSEIFEEICQLEEYYPTRAETEILTDHAREISQLIGKDSMIIEPGSGSSEKVRLLLRRLRKCQGYVPVEISKEILLRASEEIRQEFPEIPVIPVCADFTHEVKLPELAENFLGKKVIFFPGSTIGNFSPSEAGALLKNFAKTIGHGGGVLIGVDLKKDKHHFELAYDDPKGVTAKFNLNLLLRLNREIEASFDPSKFEHSAIYNEALGRVEMHLVSRVPQQVRVNQTVFSFKEGETIHTESSYKYSAEEFCELAAKARLGLRASWKDQKRLFAVYYFEKD